VILNLVSFLMLPPKQLNTSSSLSGLGVTIQTIFFGYQLAHPSYSLSFYFSFLGIFLLVNCISFDRTDWELVQVDRGFVAQVADVVGGRTAPMNEEQRLEAVKTVVGEFSKVKHIRGILSMGR